MPETAQPAPETDEKKSRGLGSYVVWAFVAVMVYVLSAGPVLLIMKKTGSQTQDVLSYIYYPWMLAYFKTPLHKPIGLYMHLWLPGVWDKDGEFSQ